MSPRSKLSCVMDINDPTVTLRQMQAQMDFHLKNLDENGYTIEKSFLSQDEVATFLGLINRYWEKVKDERYCGKPGYDIHNKFVYNLQYRDVRFIELLTRPFILKIMMPKLNDPYYGFLASDRPNYILNSFNARSSGAALDLHIDSSLPNASHCIGCVAAFMLEDSDAENGCTIVVPGSHRSGTFADRSIKGTPIPAKAGDLVIWDSRLWHGTTENTAGRSRWALNASFTVWWKKQNMDIPRGMPALIYKELNDEQKALMGFCSMPPTNEYERINTKCGYDVLGITHL